MCSNNSRLSKLAVKSYVPQILSSTIYPHSRSGSTWHERRNTTFSSRQSSSALTKLRNAAAKRARAESGYDDWMSKGSSGGGGDGGVGGGNGDRDRDVDGSGVREFNDVGADDNKIMVKSNTGPGTKLIGIKKTLINQVQGMTKNMSTASNMQGLMPKRATYKIYGQTNHFSSQTSLISGKSNFKRGPTRATETTENDTYDGAFNRSIYDKVVRTFSRQPYGVNQRNAAVEAKEIVAGISGELMTVNVDTKKRLAKTKTTTLTPVYNENVGSAAAVTYPPKPAATMLKSNFLQQQQRLGTDTYAMAAQELRQPKQMSQRVATPKYSAENWRKHVHAQKPLRSTDSSVAVSGSANFERMMRPEPVVFTKEETLKMHAKKKSISFKQQQLQQQQQQQQHKSHEARMRQSINERIKVCLGTTAPSAAKSNANESKDDVNEPKFFNTKDAPISTILLRKRGMQQPALKELPQQLKPMQATRKLRGNTLLQQLRTDKNLENQKNSVRLDNVHYNANLQPITQNAASMLRQKAKQQQKVHKNADNDNGTDTAAAVTAAVGNEQQYEQKLSIKQMTKQKSDNVESSNAVIQKFEQTQQQKLPREAKKSQKLGKSKLHASKTKTKKAAATTIATATASAVTIDKKSSSKLAQQQQSTEATKAAASDEMYRKISEAQKLGNINPTESRYSHISFLRDHFKMTS